MRRVIQNILVSQSYLVYVLITQYYYSKQPPQLKQLLKASIQPLWLSKKFLQTILLLNILKFPTLLILLPHHNQQTTLTVKFKKQVKSNRIINFLKKIKVKQLLVSIMSTTIKINSNWMALFLKFFELQKYLGFLKIIKFPICVFKTKIHTQLVFFYTLQRSLYLKQKHADRWPRRDRFYFNSYKLWKRWHELSDLRYRKKIKLKLENKKLSFTKYFFSLNVKKAFSKSFFKSVVWRTKALKQLRSHRLNPFWSKQKKLMLLNRFMFFSFKVKTSPLKTNLRLFKKKQVKRVKKFKLKKLYNKKRLKRRKRFRRFFIRKRSRVKILEWKQKYFKNVLLKKKKKKPFKRKRLFLQLKLRKNKLKLKKRLLKNLRAKKIKFKKLLLPKQKIKNFFTKSKWLRKILKIKKVRLKRWRRSKKLRKSKYTIRNRLKFFWKKKLIKRFFLKKKINKVKFIKRMVRLQTLFRKWNFYKHSKKVIKSFFWATSTKYTKDFFKNNWQKSQQFPWVEREFLTLIFRDRDFFWNRKRKMWRKKKLKKKPKMSLLTFHANKFLKRNLRKKKFRKREVKKLLRKSLKKIKPFQFVGSNLIKSVFSNNFEVSLFNNLIRKYCYQRIQKKVAKASLKFLKAYFSGFFEIFFKRRVHMIVYSNVNFKPYINWFIKFMIYKYNYVRKKISANFFLKEMVPTLLYSLKFKDLSYFNSWLKANVEKFPAKKHKSFVLFIRMIFTVYFDFFTKVFGIKGFFMDLRGKVSVTGNAKKRHVFVSVGTLNKSNRISKFEVKRNLINTRTGVMGLTIMLAY